MRQTENIILSSLNAVENEIEKQKTLPPGYVEIALSTKGKLGAPAIVHVRNFKVKDILALSLTTDVDLPVRLISILNDMILEDTDVGNWHEKEVEELMVYIFYTFYRNHLTDIVFPIEAEDIQYLMDQPDGKNLINDIKNKKYIPRTEFTISADVSTYDIPENFNPQIKIQNKTTGFYVVFDYIKYSDQIKVKRWLDSVYKEQSFRFKKIEEQLRFNKNLELQIKEDPDLIDKLIKIDPEEEIKYKEYLSERLQTTAEIVRLVSIINYNGVDTSQLNISEKYELMAQDARIDYGLISKLDKRQKHLKFGIKPEVNMLNPLTNKPCLRRFSFRIPTLLQAMQLSGTDNYDDGYNDED